MNAKIDGKATKSVPASISSAMKKGTPKATAQAKGPKPKSQVKVG